jgi:hypothetical protein
MSKQTDLINIPDAITVSGSNVGIGTSSPSNYNSGSNNLVVGASSGDNGITIATGTTNGGLLAFADGTTGNSAYRGYIQYDHNSDFLAVGSAGTEAMRIDSSGSVGIGDDTFAAGKLRVYDTAGNHVWLKGRVSDGNASVSFRNNADSAYNGRIATDDTSMNFQVNGAERMRIDGSGNLIVSGTASGQATSVALHNGGYVHAVTSHQMAGIFDRRDSDGDILIFRKDGSGTAVGSIGTGGGGINFNSQGSDFAIRRSGTDVLYVGATASYPGADNSKDLGVSSYRWKDAYLSGGVYLGGTGSANKLDDYEEGTFTPSVSVGDATTKIGVYTKVGRLVTIQCKIRGFTNTSNNEVLIIGNLPFTIGQTSKAIGSAMWAFVDTDNAYGVVYAVSGNALAFYSASENNDFDSLRCIDMDSSLNTTVYFSGTYMAT